MSLFQTVIKRLDWRLQAIVFAFLMALGGMVFLASSIRSTIASYLYLD